MAPSGVYLSMAGLQTGFTKGRRASTNNPAARGHLAPSDGRLVRIKETPRARTPGASAAQRSKTGIAAIHALLSLSGWPVLIEELNDATSLWAWKKRPRHVGARRAKPGPGEESRGRKRWHGTRWRTTLSGSWPGAAPHATANSVELVVLVRDGRCSVLSAPLAGPRQLAIRCQIALVPAVARAICSTRDSNPARAAPFGATRSTAELMETTTFSWSEPNPGQGGAFGRSLTNR